MKPLKILQLTIQGILTIVFAVGAVYTYMIDLPLIAPIVLAFFAFFFAFLETLDIMTIIKKFPKG